MTTILLHFILLQALYLPANLKDYSKILKCCSCELNLMNLMNLMNLLKTHHLHNNKNICKQKQMHRIYSSMYWFFLYFPYWFLPAQHILELWLGNLVKYSELINKLGNYPKEWVNQKVDMQTHKTNEQIHISI